MEAASDTLDLFKVAEIELVYKGKDAYQRPVIQSAKDAYCLLRNHWDDNKLELLEQFKIILLDTNSECLGIAELANGSISCCLVDVRLIFVTALKSRATSIILAHNHPSGNLKPSTQDMKLTQKIMEGGSILDVTVADHLIVTRNGYYSFANEGIMPAPF